MKGFVRKYKREVIVGVVVSLITAAIIKLGDWIITMTPAFGQTLVSTIQNIIYMTAAAQTATTVDRLLFGSLSGLFMGSFLALIGMGFKEWFRALKLERMINKRSTATGHRERKPEKPASKESESAVKNLIAEAKRLGYKAIGLTALLVVIYLFSQITIVKPAQLWSIFQNDMTMIAPYVDSHELLHLKSEWVCMQSKEDYVTLYQYIDGVKQTNNLP